MTTNGRYVAFGNRMPTIERKVEWTIHDIVKGDSVKLICNQGEDQPDIYDDGRIEIFRGYEKNILLRFAKDFFKRYRKMNRLAANILSLLLISIVVHGQDLPAPFANVSSDFGPRNCSGHSWFHDGIDYTQGEGAAINAVEWGLI